MPHFIKVKTSFVGYHRWKDAPDGVAFLRDWHRHRFGVQLTLSVDHANRALEFFQVQKLVNGYLRTLYDGVRFEKSCETIAEEVCKYFGGVSCEVDEDGENAGIYVADTAKAPADGNQ